MAKKIADEDMILNIIINGDKGKKELYGLEEGVRDLNAENEKLERSLQKYDRQIEKNGQTIAGYTKSLDKQAERESRQLQACEKAKEKFRELKDVYREMDRDARESSFGQKMGADMLKAERAAVKSSRAVMDAREQQKNLRDNIGKLTADTEKLRQKRDEDTGSLNRNRAAVNDAAARILSLRKNLDITTLSLDELNKEISVTNTRFRQTDPNDPRWKEYQATLIKLRLRQQELSQQAQQTKGVLCRMADGVNKYWGLVVSGLGSLSGVFFSIRAAVEKYTAFEDVLADTRKTTGLTRSEVLALDAALGQINTRTAQAELQGLAAVGGKLGIEGKENLEGFVRAADQINVALKEDLGGNTEEAINQVGKLVDIFKVKDNFGIEQGMLKVGSVINELGAASTANEGFIVEFSKRVAGVAPSAGVGVSEVMGLAATLDQFGQQAEASSSVYAQMMAKMFKNTGEYARIAGMDVKSFSALMNSDANEAFIRVLEGLKGNNEGMQALVANLGDMQINGVRATTILGTLADNTATLRSQQQLANEAFREGTSLTDEFNVKNNNAAAGAEKQKKIRERLITDLGEKLYPVITSANGAMNTGLNILKELTVFFIKYGVTIAQVTTVIGVYVAAVKLQALWTKNVTAALTAKSAAQRLDAVLTKSQIAATQLLAAAKALLSGNIKAATASFKAFSATINMHPLGMLLAAVTAVGIGIYKWCTYMSDAEKAQKRLSESVAGFEGAAFAEQRELAKLKSELAAATKGSEEYNRIKNTIISRYGRYDENLRDEIEKVGFLDTTYRKLTESIQKSFGARHYEKFMQGESENLEKTLSDELGNIQNRLVDDLGDELGTKYYSSIRTALLNGENLSAEILSMLDKVQDKGTIRADARLDGSIRRIREAQANFDEMDKKAQVKFGIEDKPGETDTKNDSVTNAEIIALKKRYAAGKMEKEAYEKELDGLELKHLEERLRTFTGKEEKRIELEQKIADKQVAIREKRNRDEKKAGKEEDKGKDAGNYIDALLTGDDTSTRKEEQAYIARLEKAGLYGKERAQLTAKQLAALEILEKQHQDNLRKIADDSRKKEQDSYMQGITTRIGNAERAAKIEESEMQTRHAGELAAFDGNARQKRALQQRQAREALALAESQAGDMLSLMGDIFTDIETDGLDLGEAVLPDESLAALEEKFAEVRRILSKAALDKKEGDTPDGGLKGSEVDVLGMSSEKWEQLFQNLKDGTLGVEDMATAVGVVSNAWSAYHNLRTAQEKKELKMYEQNQKKERAALDKRLAAGAISQDEYNTRTAQMDANLDAKKEELEKKQAERERRMAIFNVITSTAIGVAKTWELGPIIGPILSGLVVAMGAVQLASIMAAQYERGKYPVTGEDDGLTYQAGYVGDRMQTGIYQKPTLGLFSEKEPEMVVDGATTRRLVFNYPQIYRSIMDVSQGRTPQFASGRYPTAASAAASSPAASPSDPELRHLIEANLEMMQVLAAKKVEIPWYGRGGLDEKMRRAAGYEKEVRP